MAEDTEYKAHWEGGGVTLEMFHGVTDFIKCIKFTVLDQYQVKCLIGTAL